MSADAPPTHAARTRPWPAVVAAALVWFGLWYLTPGLHSRGVRSLVTDDDATSILVETCVALVLVAVVMLTHRPDTRALLGYDRSVWCYALPLVAGIALPFHYGMSLPLPLYLVWMATSVLWQDYLTFGLLQRYLADRLPTWAVLVGSAVVFWAGHALLLPGSFAPTHPLPSLGILVLGLALAALRLRRVTLHLILALHLGFYLVFA